MLLDDTAVVDSSKLSEEALDLFSFSPAFGQATNGATIKRSLFSRQRHRIVNLPVSAQVSRRIRLLRLQTERDFCMKRRPLLLCAKLSVPDFLFELPTHVGYRTARWAPYGF